MEPIFSMSSLQRNPSAVKQEAADNVVRITEQGNGAYVFCSEAVFERRIARERAEAAYEARLVDAVGRGIADIEEGRYFTSVDQVFGEAAARRNQHV